MTFLSQYILTEKHAARGTHPLAAVFGTHGTLSILTRVQRGTLRLIALENYLLARAKKGRDAAVLSPRERERAPARPTAEPPAEEPARPRRLPFDPDSLHIPTLKELEAEVRRRPIGRARDLRRRRFAGCDQEGAVMTELHTSIRNMPMPVRI